MRRLFSQNKEFFSLIDFLIIFYSLKSNNNHRAEMSAWSISNQLYEILGYFLQQRNKEKFSANYFEFCSTPLTLSLYFLVFESSLVVTYWLS